jgi:hypothetical protein
VKPIIATRTSVIVGILFLAVTTGALAQMGSKQMGPEGDHHVVPTERPGTADGFSLASLRPADGYVPGRADQKVWALQEEVKNVRQEWTDTRPHTVHQTSSMSDSALGLANALIRIPDKLLGLGALVIRDEYACFGLVIAGANSSSLQVRESLGRRAEILCASTSAHLRNANELASRDGSALAVIEWARSSDEAPRLAYLSAMSVCLQSPRRQVVSRAIQLIPAYYLTRYPPTQDVVLRSCVGP